MSMPGKHCVQHASLARLYHGLLDYYPVAHIEYIIMFTCKLQSVIVNRSIKKYQQ